MRLMERASRQNHQPLPAHLDRFAGTAEENQANASLLCVPLWPSVVTEPESSGSNPFATDPLHTNSNEMNVPSGVAERAAFFVENSQAKGNGCNMCVTSSATHSRAVNMRLVTHATEKSPFLFSGRAARVAAPPSQPPLKNYPTIPLQLPCTSSLPL